MKNNGKNPESFTLPNQKTKKEISKLNRLSLSKEEIYDIQVKINFPMIMLLKPKDFTYC